MAALRTCSVGTRQVFVRLRRGVKQCQNCKCFKPSRFSRLQFQHIHTFYIFLHDKTVSKSFKKGLKIGRSTYQMKAWWKWNAVFVRYLLRIWAMKLNFGQSTLHCSNSIWRKLLVGSATFESQIGRAHV